MDERARFSVIWQDALQRYTQTTGRAISSLLQPLTIDELCSQIDAECATYQQFRERRKGIYDALSSISAPLAMVSDIASNSVSQTFPPSGVVFGAVKYLVQAAREVSASLDAITDLFRTISDFLDRLRVYSRAEISSALQERLRNVLIVLLDLVGVATKLVRDGHLARWKKFGRIVLLGRDERVRDLIDQLDKLTDSEHRLVGAETLVGTKQIGKTVEATQSSVTHISAQMNQLSISSTTQEAKMDQLLDAFQQSKTHAEASREATALRLLKDILRPSPTSQDRFDAIRRMKEQHQVTGSGDWFFSEPSTKSWLAGGIPLAFVSGRPGSGKSFIAHGLVEHLQNHWILSSQVVYFFFQETRAESRSFHQALLDLAFQLAQTNITYAKHVVGKCVSFKEVSTLGSAWRKLFLDYFMIDDGLGASTFIVLDALDEAKPDERSAFFQMLHDYRSRDRPKNLSIIMFGRPDVGHELDEELLDIPTVYVDANKNSTDISRYVSAGIGKSKTLRQLSSDLKSEIALALATNANGMFLYARLMLAELGKKSRPSAIRDALRRPPSGLTAMIRHVLETLASRLSFEDADDLNDIIAWVTCAVEPLSLARIDATLRIKNEEGDGVLDLEHRLRIQYASLFELTREDRLTTADLERGVILPIGAKFTDAVAGADNTEPDGQPTSKEFNSNPFTTTITFSHASIADFFRSLDAGVSSSGSADIAIGCKLDEARFRTLSICVDLLSDSQLRAKLTPSSTFNQYVASSWISHLRDARPSAATMADLDQVKVEDLAAAIVKTLVLGPGCEQWYQYINTDEFSMDNAKQILSFPGVRKACSGIDWGCSRNVEDCPIVLFAPAMRANAEGWLQGSFKPGICASLIYAFVGVLNGAAELDIPSTIDEAQILAAAEWADLEQTSTWFAKVGAALRDAGLLKQAVPYMWRAEMLDHSRYAVNHALARIYMEQGSFSEAQERFTTAIEIGRISRATGPRAFFADLLISRAQCYEMMAEKHADSDATLHSIFKLRAVDSLIWVMCADGYLPNITGYVAHAATLVKMLYTITIDLEYGHIHKWSESSSESGRRWMMGNGRSFEVTSSWCLEKIMATLISMHSTVMDEDEDNPRPRSTMLIEAILCHDGPGEYFLVGAGLAAKHMDKLPWLLERYSEAIEIASRRLHHIQGLYLINCVAQIYARFVGNTRKALELWEFVLDRTLSTGAPDDRVSNCQDYALSRLTEAYITLTVADKECAKHYVARLEEHAKHFKARHGGGVSTWAGANVFIIEAALSTLYITCGDEDKARDLLRPHVKGAIAILSDDDPQNDRHGFQTIMEASKTINDRANTLAAMYPRCEYKDGKALLRQASRKLHPPLLSGRIEASIKAPAGTYSYVTGLSLKSAPDASVIAETPWGCDGPCSRHFIDSDGVRVTCCYCPDTDFCMDCYAMLKSDKLLYSICSSKHDFIEFPALKEDQAFKEGETVVGDRIISLEEWKKEIASAWGIDK